MNRLYTVVLSSVVSRSTESVSSGLVRNRVSGSIQTPLNELCPLQTVHFLGMFEKLDSNGL